jgi:hypothetical protein
MPIHGDWSPQHPAVWREERQVGGASRVVMLRHADHPCIFDLVAASAHELDARLIDTASLYLERAAPVLHLPQDWSQPLTQLDEAAQFDFAWLPIRWGAPHLHAAKAQPDPRLSFWLQLSATADGAVLDRTLVLLGGWVWREDDELRSLGSGQGLRVVAHVQAMAADATKFRARFTGLSLALPEAPLPRSATIRQLREQRTSYVGWVTDALGGQADEVRIGGVRVDTATDGSDVVTLQATATGLSPQRGELAYDIIATVQDEQAVTIDALCERVSHGDGERPPGETLLIDPSSDPASGPANDPDAGNRRRARGRRRADELLSRFRQPSSLTKLRPTSSGLGLVGLRELEWFQIRRSEPDRDATQAAPSAANTEVISRNADVSLRTRGAAAAHAYRHTYGLFDRLSAFGLAPETYFKFARLPLVVDPRGRMTTGPGRDGRSINAEVLFFPGAPQNAWERAELDRRPWLRVNLALGDRARRSRPALSLLGGPRDDRRPDSLGIATDGRWAWHEFGHVLVAASVDELELRFAHSVGDALAAIIADPLSAPGGDALRGLTFPWIASIRRHDRSPDLGWSWCGSFHRATRRGDTRKHCNRKAYVSEQLLSSTLFRAYRSLGGDTAAQAGDPGSAADARQEAADYVTYLVMRSVALLGPAKVVPAETPDSFASALIDADAGTESWQVTAGWPYRSPARERQLTRVGGCAHKVIRWAFEAQGLYAKGSADVIVDAPGEPPPVDVFIADRRGGSPGDYTPVSLDWGQEDPPQPAWSASDGGIEWDREGASVAVRIGNRGREADAAAVRLRLWWFDLGSDAAAARARLREWRFDPQQLAAIDVSVGTVPRGDLTGVRGGPFEVPQALRSSYVLLVAEASCGADPAITDPATDLPTTRIQTPLVQLIAGDNNLALRVLPSH